MGPSIHAVSSVSCFSNGPRRIVRARLYTTLGGSPPGRGVQEQGLRTFSWRPNARIWLCSLPRNASGRWNSISRHQRRPPKRSNISVIRPDGAWNAGRRRIPVTSAIWRNPSSPGNQAEDDRTGIERHARKQADRRLGAGVSAVAHWAKAHREGGMAALPPRNGNAAQDGGTPSRPRRDDSSGDDGDVCILSNRGGRLGLVPFCWTRR